MRKNKKDVKVNSKQEEKKEKRTCCRIEKCVSERDRETTTAWDTLKHSYRETKRRRES